MYDENVHTDELLDFYVPPCDHFKITESVTKVNSIVIDGIVSFDDSDGAPEEYTLEARWILVKGGALRAGSADKPFSRKLNIVITGGKELDFFVIDNSIEPANKAIGVTGDLELYGNAP